MKRLPRLTKKQRALLRGEATGRKLLNIHDIDHRISAVQPAELEPTGWSAWATSSAEGP